jgi:hypothetical protein
MRVTHLSFDPSVQGAAAAEVTITVTRGKYVVAAKSPAKVLGSQCAPFPAGTVIANFSKVGPTDYRGSYTVFNTQTCLLNSVQSMSVTAPTSSSAGTRYRFFGIPQYQGVFVKM